MQAYTVAALTAAELELDDAYASAAMTTSTRRRDSRELTHNDSLKLLREKDERRNGMSSRHSFAGFAKEHRHLRDGKISHISIIVGSLTSSYLTRTYYACMQIIHAHIHLQSVILRLRLQ